MDQLSREWADLAKFHSLADAKCEISCLCPNYAGVQAEPSLEPSDLADFRSERGDGTINQCSITDKRRAVLQTSSITDKRRASG